MNISLADHAAEIPRPAISAQVGRYLQTIATVLRPRSVAGRAASLEVFFCWLAQAHPMVQRLDQLTRGWTSETARHDRTLAAINTHIRRHDQPALP